MIHQVIFACLGCVAYADVIPYYMGDSMVMVDSESLPVGQPYLELLKKGLPGREREDSMPYLLKKVHRSNVKVEVPVPQEPSKAPSQDEKMESLENPQPIDSSQELDKSSNPVFHEGPIERQATNSKNDDVVETLEPHLETAAPEIELSGDLQQSVNQETQNILDSDTPIVKFFEAKNEEPEIIENQESLEHENPKQNEATDEVEKVIKLEKENEDDVPHILRITPVESPLDSVDVSITPTDDNSQTLENPSPSKIKLKADLSKLDSGILKQEIDLKYSEHIGEGPEIKSTVSVLNYQEGGQIASQDEMTMPIESNQKLITQDPLIEEIIQKIKLLKAELISKGTSGLSPSQINAYGETVTLSVGANLEKNQKVQEKNEVLPLQLPLQTKDGAHENKVQNVLHPLNGNQQEINLTEEKREEEKKTGEQSIPPIDSLIKTKTPPKVLLRKEQQLPQDMKQPSNPKQLDDKFQVLEQGTRIANNVPGYKGYTSLPHVSKNKRRPNNNRKNVKNHQLNPDDPFYSFITRFMNAHTNGEGGDSLFIDDDSKIIHEISPTLQESIKNEKLQGKKTSSIQSESPAISSFFYDFIKSSFEAEQEEEENEPPRMEQLSRHGLPLDRESSVTLQKNPGGLLLNSELQEFIKENPGKNVFVINLDTIDRKSKVHAIIQLIDHNTKVTQMRNSNENYLIIVKETENFDFKPSLETDTELLPEERDAFLRTLQESLKMSQEQKSSAPPPEPEEEREVHVVRIERSTIPALNHVVHGRSSPLEISEMDFVISDKGDFNLIHPYEIRSYQGQQTDPLVRHGKIPVPIPVAGIEIMESKRFLGPEEIRQQELFLKKELPHLRFLNFREQYSHKKMPPDSGSSHHYHSGDESRMKIFNIDDHLKSNTEEELIRRESCLCGIRLSTRIVGGHPTGIEDYPWMAQLLYRSAKQKFFCGGSLINDRYILTAAHCVYDLSPSDFEVKLGASTVDSPGTKFEISEIINHPNYDHKDYTNYDLSLLKLKGNVTYSAVIIPVCINNQLTSKRGIVTGWGMTKSKPSSNVLRAAVVSVMNPRVCLKRSNYNRRELPHNKVFCARAKGKDSCHGDSGGPLVINEGNHFSISGIVSWGQGCARARFPGVYTKVAAYRNWIENITKHANYCLTPNKIRL